MDKPKYYREDILHILMKRNNLDDISIGLELQPLKDMILRDNRQSRLPYSESHLTRAGRKR